MMCAVLKCPSNKEHLVTKKHYFPPFYSNDRLIEKKIKHEKKKRKARFQTKTQRHLPYKNVQKKTVLGASVLSSKPVEKKHADSEASSLTIPLLLLSSQNKQKKISLNLSIADLKIYVSDRALNKCTQWNDYFLFATGLILIYL